ncbi:MAG: hypothetical protein Q9227_008565 [Pyrenula ochraceoflavens]
MSNENNFHVEPHMAWALARGDQTPSSQDHPGLAFFIHENASLFGTRIKLILIPNEIIYRLDENDFFIEVPNYNIIHKNIVDFLLEDIELLGHILPAKTGLEAQMMVNIAQNIIGNKRREAYEASDLGWGTTRVQYSNKARQMNRAMQNGDFSDECEDRFEFEGCLIERATFPGQSREIISFFEEKTLSKLSHKCVVDTAAKSYPKPLHDHQESSWKVYAKAMSRVLRVVALCEADVQYGLNKASANNMHPNEYFAFISARVNSALCRFYPSKSDDFDSAVRRLEKQKRGANMRLRLSINKNIETIRGFSAIFEERRKNRPLHEFLEAHQESLRMATLQGYVQNETTHVKFLEGEAAPDEIDQVKKNEQSFGIEDNSLVK